MRYDSGIVFNTLILLVLTPVIAFAQQVDFQKTAEYLDGKQKNWFEWRNSKRGETRCIACHTNTTYALVRHDLKRVTDSNDLTIYNETLLANTKLRVKNWTENQLFYGGRKAGQSRGTEAIMNAVILAENDAGLGRTKISGEARRAFEILLSLQIEEGDAQGAWPWLNFDLQPWESKQGQYYGAALAAIALGRAPGNYAGQSALKDKTDALKKYLLKHYGEDEPCGDAKLSLYNRTYLLWASSELDGLLKPEQQKALIARIFEKQNDDGGWALPSLGQWKRLDNTQQSQESDGYATGLVTLAILKSEQAEDGDRLKAALAWLAKNQNDDGSWTGLSVNKDRTNSREPVRGFFTHAATAMSSMALIESQRQNAGNRRR